LGGEKIKVSARSSAVQEDVMASFAGQYETALNVPREELLTEYKHIMASLFTPRALFYYKDKGFHVEEMAMAVGVLAMIDAKTSGILYTRDPENPGADALLINAVWGLGSYAVGGKVPSESYRVTQDGNDQISREQTEQQKAMLNAQPNGGTEEVPVPEEIRGTPCLDDKTVSKLASWARQMENHFGQPQDVEWAIDQEGKPYLLQSRPLRIGRSTESAEEPSISKSTEGHKLLLDKGVIASRGTAAGPVKIITSEEELANFPDGAVLVIRRTPPEFAVFVPKAAAIISDVGAVLGHLATVAREYNVPAIFNTQDATRVLSDNVEVTVDAVRANVYEGIVKELLKEKGGKPVESSPALGQLLEILQLITPLNLTDPSAPEFRPSGCKTLHDITRFAHEVSMHAMFDLSKESHFAEKSTKQLVCEVPMQWWIIDLGDGIKPEAAGGKKAHIEDITSVPMRAVWEGITALPWKGPPPINTKGFLSVMFGATTDPSIDPSVGKRFADKNYIILSKYFCNLNSRLGFHFSTTEAYVGENANENYVSFVFKGGAADIDRRTRRVQFVGKLLKYYDFRIEIKDDALFARLEGHEPGYLTERLKVLGHIMTHTRQLDMVMYNDTMVNYYYEDMLKNIKTIVDEDMLKNIKTIVDIGTDH
jgi:pyruvate,water dikinase